MVSALPLKNGELLEICRSGKDHKAVTLGSGKGEIENELPEQIHQNFAETTSTPLHLKWYYCKL